MREQTHYDKYPQAPVSIAEIKAIYDNAGMNLRQGVKIGNLEKILLQLVLTVTSSFLTLCLQAIRRLA